MDKHQENRQAKKRLLWETLIVIAITIILFLIFNNLSSIIPILPVIYLLIERKERHRSWSEIGFKIRNISFDLRIVWYFILLVGAISPLLTSLTGKYCVPGYIEHVKSRLPMDLNTIMSAIIAIAIGSFLEEIIFRGFIQYRLELFTTPVKSIIISSFLFTFMHYSKGSFLIVTLDMLGIFIDSIIYGIIFTKTKNIFVSWIAHYLSDLIAVICLLYFY
ncbi:CPBP family intramembrane metalloprotease [Clostridium sp. 19966]|uniref:CPBP family intramembrane glutamic endopeptidase n=1 Tax=Clostridium sp. 19966 TaxID=2768166 RepID=UPI0028E03C8F|nr:type II CAAX endopeptidase family protein [Clostridium sp. 19966]MDT8715384.1 CPBP family intramembrane metalloprotease [Clostridium sp. 19966]